jgi:hypothetical protein
MVFVFCFCASNDGRSGGTEEERQGLHDTEDDINFIAEVDMALYEGTFFDYSEAVVQFGFVNLFSVILPYIGVIALIENFFKVTGRNRVEL